MYACIVAEMKKAQVTEGVEPYQRPWGSGSMADDKITLHDAIMRDDSVEEGKLDEILDKWEAAHGKFPAWRLVT